MRRAFGTLLVLIAACAAPSGPDSRTFHLGVTGQPEWEEFEKLFPHGARLDLPFKGRANETEQTLFIRQDNVKRNDWFVELNGRRLGKLIDQEMPTVCTLAIPRGALVDGENKLSILPPKEPDDALIGVRLDPRPVAEAVGEAQLQVLVVGAPEGGAIPARVTIVDSSGSLPPLLRASDDPLAVRPGVVYTGNGH